jgi:peptidoglycan/LPS O-acetylase OafA/YrhL
MAEKKIYFKGLNALRFFAASAVIFHHIEQHKYWLGYDSLWGYDGVIGVFIDSIGHKAVSFFFALSGFLITYLLLAEIKKTKTVAVKKFYFRRILRIWPLYYLVAAVALFVIPAVTNFQNIGSTEFFSFNGEMSQPVWFILLLYLIILPNFTRITSVQVVGANQAWSVGVEEQFYLIWPLLVRWFHKKFFAFLIIFTVAKMALQGICLYIGQYTEISSALRFEQIGTILSHMQIEQMAIGGIGAYWLFNNKVKMINLIYHPITHTLAWVFFTSFYFVDYHFFGATLFEGFIFMLIIMNVSTNPSFKLNLDRPWLNKLGDVSYGIYMLHTIVIALLISFLHSLEVSNVVLNLALYILAPTLTIGLSLFSYEYFEKFFLKFKNKFAVVKSGRGH